MESGRPVLGSKSDLPGRAEGVPGSRNELRDTISTLSSSASSVTCSSTRSVRNLHSHLLTFLICIPDLTALLQKS